jgi:hypothetical protein
MKVCTGKEAVSLGRVESTCMYLGRKTVSLGGLRYVLWKTGSLYSIAKEKRLLK